MSRGRASGAKVSDIWDIYIYKCELCEHQWCQHAWYEGELRESERRVRWKCCGRSLHEHDATRRDKTQHDAARHGET